MLSITNRVLSTSARAAFSTSATTAVRAKHTLPDLPYDYSALEPVISADIMKVSQR